MVNFDVCDLMHAKSPIQKIDHISKTKSRTKNLMDQKKRSFKSGQIYRKGAECAETNEKTIFRFRVMVDFVLKIHRKLTDF